MDTTKSEVYLKMEKEILVKIIDNKRECIKMLKERIDKAIVYIEKGQESALNSLINGVSNIEIISFQHILDILKGSDEDE